LQDYHCSETVDPLPAPGFSSAKDRRGTKCQGTYLESAERCQGFSVPGVAQSQEMTGKLHFAFLIGGNEVLDILF